MRSTLDLAISYQSDEQILQNPYSVIIVNPAKHLSAEIRSDLATRFVTWITSDVGQSLIADFRVDGTSLFVPCANREAE